MTILTLHYILFPLSFKGPECFNYGFPQDIDDEFLLISDTLPGDVPWKYVNGDELLSFLSEKIDEGFTFPLNPKWVLCDPGWKKVYDKLLSSQKPNVQESMEIWFPNLIRKRIDEIASTYPSGFSISNENDSADGLTSGIKADLAQEELRRYMVFQQGRRKLEKAMHSDELHEHITLSKGKSFFATVQTLVRQAKEDENAATKITTRKKGSIKSRLKRNSIKSRLKRNSDVCGEEGGEISLDDENCDTGEGKAMQRMERSSTSLPKIFGYVRRRFGGKRRSSAV